jgi:polyribonucleotide nucleotidyltransferase
VGDKVQVEIAEVDPRGKLSLVPVTGVDGATAGGESAESAVTTEQTAGS